MTAKLKPAFLLILLSSLAVTLGCEDVSSRVDGNAADVSQNSGTSEDDRATVKVTADNFERLVANSDKPVLLDFWAPWCGPCRIIAPSLDALADEYEGVVTIGKVNVDQQKELASKFNVSAIPAFIYFKEGEMVEATHGVKSKKEIKADIEKVLEM